VVFCKWLHCDSWPFSQVSDLGPFGPSCYINLHNTRHHALCSGYVPTSTPVVTSTTFVSLSPTPSATFSTSMTSSYVTPVPTYNVTLQGSIKITNWDWDENLYDFSSDYYSKTFSRLSGIVSLHFYPGLLFRLYLRLFLTNQRSLN